jgi:hypothetical protein
MWLAETHLVFSKWIGYHLETPHAKTAIWVIVWTERVTNNITANQTARLYGGGVCFWKEALSRSLNRPRCRHFRRRWVCFEEVRLDVFTAMIIHLAVFWLATSYSYVLGYLKMEAASSIETLVSYHNTTRSEDGGRQILRNVGILNTTLYCVTTQKTSTWISPSWSLKTLQYQHSSGCDFDRCPH